MRTPTLSFAFLLGSFLLGSSLLAACATDASSTTADDDLAGESAADGAKADENALQDTFGIYTATKVGAFECNGAGSCTHVDLALAGRSSTTCADGTSKHACSVRTLDFGKLALSASALDKVTSKLQASAATPEIGAQLLVRGTYVHGTSPIAQGDWVTFQVTELWVAQLPESVTDGTFVMVRESGIRCITAPCASLNENRLNSSRNVNIHGIDWATGMSDEMQGTIYDATTQRDGVILVGDRTHGKVNGQATTLRTVNQAFVRVK